MKHTIKNTILREVGLVFLLLIVIGSIGYWKYEGFPKIEKWSKEGNKKYSDKWHRPGKYWETYKYHTPNLHEGKNEVKAVVLHHTASEGTGEIVAKELCRPNRDVSCHVVIDTDGTRYVIAYPDEIAFHAGYSKLGNRFRVNAFSIGIEFHGNTLERPLTNEQIESAIEYLRPIIKEYHIPAQNIVTHQMIREAYIKSVPRNTKALPKVDITPTEYNRVLHALDTANLLISNRKYLK